MFFHREKCDENTKFRLLQKVKYDLGISKNICGPALVKLLYFTLIHILLDQEHWLICNDGRIG